MGLNILLLSGILMMLQLWEAAGANFQGAEDEGLMMVIEIVLVM